MGEPIGSAPIEGWELCEVSWCRSGFWPSPQRSTACAHSAGTPARAGPW